MYSVSLFKIKNMELLCFYLPNRDCAVKFNDYFEFPREFDLEPFTVEGLAKIEGEVIEEDIIEQSAKTTFIDDDKEKSTIYKLVGVTVHSGQASGGHYYSYITNRYLFCK